MNLRKLFVLAVLGVLITWITGWKLLLVPYVVFWLIVYWIIGRAVYRGVRSTLRAAALLTHAVREQRA